MTATQSSRRETVHGRIMEAYPIHIKKTAGDSYARDSERERVSSFGELLRSGRKTARTDELSDRQIYLLAPSHPRVGFVNQQKILHLGKACAANGNFSVISTRNPVREQRIQRAIAGNNAQFELGRTKPSGHARIGGAELLAGRARGEPVKAIVFQSLGQFTSLIGRSEHHDAAEIYDFVIS